MALEGFEGNRRHALKKLCTDAGFYGALSVDLLSSMQLVRFQILQSASMTFSEFRRRYERALDAREAEEMGPPFFERPPFFEPSSAIASTDHDRNDKAAEFSDGEAYGRWSGGASPPERSSMSASSSNPDPQTESPQGLGATGTTAASAPYDSRSSASIGGDSDQRTCVTAPGRTRMPYGVARRPQLYSDP